MSQLDLGDVWTDDLASCSCGGALLVHDQRGLREVVRVTRCARCGGEQRVVVRPPETAMERAQRLRGEVVR
jgi:hypothetical protein